MRPAREPQRGPERISEGELRIILEMADRQESLLAKLEEALREDDVEQLKATARELCGIAADGGRLL